MKLEKILMSLVACGALAFGQRSRIQVKGWVAPSERLAAPPESMDLPTLQDLVRALLFERLGMAEAFEPVGSAVGEVEATLATKISKTDDASAGGMVLTYEITGHRLLLGRERKVEETQLGADEIHFKPELTQVQDAVSRLATIIESLGNMVPVRRWVKPTTVNCRVADILAMPNRTYLVVSIKANAATISFAGTPPLVGERLFLSGTARRSPSSLGLKDYRFEIPRMLGEMTLTSIGDHVAEGSISTMPPDNKVSSASTGLTTIGDFNPGDVVIIRRSINIIGSIAGYNVMGAMKVSDVDRKSLELTIATGAYVGRSFDPIVRGRYLNHGGLLADAPSDSAYFCPETQTQGVKP